MQLLNLIIKMHLQERRWEIMARTEEYKVSGEDIMKKIKALINEGNIRRITIKSKDDKVIAQFPLTVWVVGTVFLPVLAAIGTIVALVSECTIAVEREDKTEASDTDEPEEELDKETEEEEEETEDEETAKE